MKPWKSLLEIPARASWRVTEDSLSSESSAIAQAARSLLQSSVNRSSFQSVKCHQEVVEKQKALSNRRDRERLRILMDNDGYKATGNNNSKKDAHAQPIAYGVDESLQQIRYRLVPQYAIMKRVLQEAKSLLMTSDDSKLNWKPERVIDFGIGCGSASAAAIDIWNIDDLHSIKWVHGIDASQTMRETAQYFLEEFLKLRLTGIQTDNSTKTNPESVKTRVTTASHLASSIGSPTSFDLAIMSYAASELPQNAATLAAAALLWQKLSPGGIFVMVEPGTPDGFSSVRTVRNMLLHCVNDKINSSNESLTTEKFDGQFEEQCHVIAPCTHNGACPLERFHSLKLKLKTRSEKQHQAQNEQDSKHPSLDHVDESDSEESDDSDDDIDNIEGNEDDEQSSDDMKSEQGFCSFVQTMPNNSKGEKFTYLVLQKRVIDRCYQREQSDESTTTKTADEKVHFEDLHVADLLWKTREESVDNTNESLIKHVVELESQFLASSEDELGLELLRGDINRQSFGRIIRAPKKKKGHVLIDVCASPGIITRHTVRKSMADVMPGIYSAARKSRWGGLWPHVQLQPTKT